MHHGLCVGFFIPQSFQFCAKVTDKHLAICKALDIPASDAQEGLNNLLAKVREFLTSLNAPLALKDFGISSEDFEQKLPKLIEYSFGDISCYLSPRPITPEQCEQVMRYAYDGKDINGNLVAVAFREYGTLMYMDMGMTLGDTPAKYFTKSVFPVRAVTGQALRQNYSVANYACRGCPIGCGRDLKEFKPGLDVDGPEYETTVAFGPLCMNTDFDSIIEANHLCNVHGIDTISAGVSVAYAIYLYEQGAITKDQVGFELKWGDGAIILKLVEMIVSQEGIGELISKGTLAMARELGRDEGEAAQIKGLEIPMHDARAFHGLAVSYATGPRGACHLKGDYYNIDLGNMILEYMILPSDRLVSEGKGEPAAKFQSFKDLFDALTLCKFAPLQVPQLCDMLNALTGWEFSPEDLLAAGDRSVNIKRAVSNMFGLTREHDTVPKICLDALEEGTTAGVQPDLEVMLKEYYQYRGWDWETGKPGKEKLIELGLDHVAEDFYS